MSHDNDQNNSAKSPVYPHFEALLSEKGLSLKGMYTYADAMQIFGCSKRALQDYVKDGKLDYRILPGRAHWLSADFEKFLQNSLKDSDSRKRKRQ